MSFKTVLVHIDDSARSASRIDAAARLAVDSGAHLVAIYLVPTPELAPSVAALFPASVLDRRQQEIGEAQHDAERQFRDAARGAGIDRIEWRAPAGPALPAGVAHARCADLFVLGQRDPADADAEFAQQLITSTLLSSGRPLLIIPHTGAPQTVGKNVLVAWDGGREAARAVGDALPLLERAEQVTIIAANGSGANDVAIALSRTRLVGWLRDHGVAARVTTDVGQADVGESLLSSAADLGADLIVMGGYGHARLQQFVMGGVTRTILGAMTAPVLMSH